MNSKKIYRNKMHILLLLINLAIIFVLKCPELHDNVVHIFTSRKELVFFYSNVFSGYYIIVNVTRHLLYAVTVLLVISWCYSHVPNKCGRILYNTALGTLAGALVVYMALSMIVARSFMRIFVPFILITILLVVLIVLNERFYRKNDDEAYRANKPLLRLIPLLLLYLLWIFIGAVYVVNRLPEEYESDYEFYLTYYESRLHVAIGSIEYISKNMAETNYMYVNVWFVNNFSKDGKEYNVEELAEEAYNLQTRNGKSWYRFQQFVDSYWEIQHSYDYDFEKYYFDNWNKTDIYSQIFVSGVSRRLENMGETLEDASREDVDSACEYVKNVIVSDEEIKPVEKISLEIVAPVPGEAPDYDITFESGNGYVASIYEWNRVSKVGVRNSIETLTPENGKVFEDDSVYCAEIHVIHDVDYTIDEYSVDADIHGESFSSYKVNDGIDDGDIIISVWYETGDPTSHGLVDSINIDSIGNISIGDSTVYDESMVRTDNENVVVTDVSWYCLKQYRLPGNVSAFHLLSAAWILSALSPLLQ